MLKCADCKGKGTKLISVEREVIRDCHRSGGVYYENIEARCFSCKGTGKYQSLYDKYNLKKS